MERSRQRLIDALNDPDKKVRLDSLRQLIELIRLNKSDRLPNAFDINNHIHTTYSFSCYSPAKALWEAYSAGMCSAGIMDHDSICGAREFIMAGEIAGIATTVGVECRADFSSTRLNGRRINNPDQISNAYIALHGIPHHQIETVRNYFEPVINARHKRNRLMTDRINTLLSPKGITLNYSRDVLPLSNHLDGGTVTERHLLFALSRRMIEVFGKGAPLLDFLQNELEITVPSQTADLLHDPGNVFYEYDLLALLKGEFSSAFYIEATDECPDISHIIEFAKKCGCISAYAYLGDVTTSITGDKHSQKFEDDHLDEVIAVIKELGFEAVTYMPSRNSPGQLSRLMELCRQNELLEICGEDINSPRQPFLNPSLRKQEFRHLADTTWALIGHEKAASADRLHGFFSSETIKQYPSIKERIQHFKDIGLLSHAVMAI